MRKLILILLGIFIVAIVGFVVAYGLIHIYREYKRTKAPAARKVKDIETQMVAAEKRSLHKVLSRINASNVPLVPLSRPREKQAQAPVVSVDQRTQEETPIHTRLARLPVEVTRSCSDSELVSRVPVPPIVVPTASQHRLIRSPRTIAMCDRYPTFASPHPSPLSEPGDSSPSTEKLQVTTAEMCEHHNESTTVTVLPNPPTTAAEKPGPCMIDEYENAEKDGPGIVTDPTPNADASVSIDAEIFGSLLAYLLP